MTILVPKFKLFEFLYDIFLFYRIFYISFWMIVNFIWNLCLVKPNIIYITSKSYAMFVCLCPKASISKHQSKRIGIYRNACFLKLNTFSNRNGYGIFISGRIFFRHLSCSMIMSSNPISVSNLFCLIISNLKFMLGRTKYFPSIR